MGRGEEVSGPQMGTWLVQYADFGGAHPPARFESQERALRQMGVKLRQILDQVEKHVQGYKAAKEDFVRYRGAPTNGVIWTSISTTWG